MKLNNLFICISKFAWGLGLQRWWEKTMWQCVLWHGVVPFVGTNMSRNML